MHSVAAGSEVIRSSIKTPQRDPGAEDCRSVLINYIRNEQVGIDVKVGTIGRKAVASECIARTDDNEHG